MTLIIFSPFPPCVMTGRLSFRGSDLHDTVFLTKKNLGSAAANSGIVLATYGTTTSTGSAIHSCFIFPKT